MHFLKNGYSQTLQGQQICLYTHHQWALLLALLILFSFHLKCPKILEKHIRNTGKKKKNLPLQILLLIRILRIYEVWCIVCIARVPPRQGCLRVIRANHVLTVLLVFAYSSLAKHETLEYSLKLKNNSAIQWKVGFRLISRKDSSSAFSLVFQKQSERWSIMKFQEQEK